MFLAVKHVDRVYLDLDLWSTSFGKFQKGSIKHYKHFFFLLLLPETRVALVKLNSIQLKQAKYTEILVKAGENCRVGHFLWIYHYSHLMLSFYALLMALSEDVTSDS